MVCEETSIAEKIIFKNILPNYKKIKKLEKELKDKNKKL